MTKLKTVAQVLAEGLQRHSVEIMFSQSLPSALLLAAEDLGIRQFSYRTENAGTVMADAYARITHKVGVVTAQNGPAATLLVPGMAEAIKASVPIVALVQEVATTQSDKNAFQEFDHIALFQSCTKWSRVLNDPDRALDYLDMAFANAVSGRPGPVALMLPADILNMPCNPKTPRKNNLGAFPLDRMVPSDAEVTRAADLLADARNPLVVVGGGVHLSGACDEVAALQAENLPVVTTVMGKGAINEDHPLSIGVSGYAMGKLAPARHMKWVFDEADVILMVGTKANQNGTDSWSLYPKNATYIHIDIDGTEIGRNYEAELRLVGDAKLALAALVAKLRGRRAAAPHLEARIAEGRVQHKKDMAASLAASEKEGLLRPERLMEVMQGFLTSETIVTADASYSSLWVACYLQSRTPGTRFITPRGLAGLGWGYPMGLGAKLARPASPVFSLVGDGGFGHVWGELETAMRTKTPVILTVLNNGILGYQKHAENAKFGRHTTACYFAPVDHGALARACGMKAVTVRTAEEYRTAIAGAVDSGESILMDAMVTATAFPPVTLFDTLESGA